MRAIFAVILLLGSAGLALAQTQGSGRREAMPEVRAASPAAQDPAVNPNAAGTQAGGRSGALPQSVMGGGEHGGSKNLTANDHPFEALKYNRLIRKHQGWRRSLQRQTGSSNPVQSPARNTAGH